MTSCSDFITDTLQIQKKVYVAKQGIFYYSRLTFKNRASYT